MKWNLDIELRICLDTFHIPLKMSNDLIYWPEDRVQHLMASSDALVPYMQRICEVMQ